MFSWSRTDRAAHSALHGLACLDVSRTVQSSKEEADINTIVRNFGVTGKLPQNVRMPTFEDFSEVGDFREALQAIESAEESFAQMPSNVRARFENNPALFVDFCSDERNRDEARSLGLLVDPVPAQVVAPGPPGE